jgi:hypothetical protein
VVQIALWAIGRWGISIGDDGSEFREIIGFEERLVSCAICEQRKEKRFCPALHGRICAQCCGQQREVTIDCPSDCTYLRQAREHEKVRTVEDVDQSAMFPEIEIPEHFLYEHRELIMGISFALANCARGGGSLGGSVDGSVGNLSLADHDLIAALSSLVQSYRTLVESSLIYEQATTNLVHQKIAREVARMVNEFRDEEVKHLGYSRLKDSDVLKALVFWVRMAITRTSGRPKSRAFVDFLFTQFQEKVSGIAAPEDAKSRIIVP